MTLKIHKHEFRRRNIFPNKVGTEKRGDWERPFLIIYGFAMVYTISRDIHLVSGGSPTYNIPFAFCINIHQQTDVEQSPFQQLLGAVLNLVKRHEALRTVLLGPRAGLDGFI